MIAWGIDKYLSRYFRVVLVPSLLGARLGYLLGYLCQSGLPLAIIARYSSKIIVLAQGLFECNTGS